tara:strand:- start:220 stop:681 length:462 start_codon:yes stop_codon:yes gene_type:complete
MINIIYNRFYFILLSITIVFADQLAKYIISVNSISLINKNFIIFSLDYVKNFGAAFNLFNGSRIFLSLVSISVAILIIFLILTKKSIKNIDLLSYSFVLGGTLGNGIDRIIKGYVIDFINLNFIEFPVFNIADISINIGLVVIIYSFIKYKRI